MENLARINLELDEILVSYLDPLARIIGHGMDENIDQAEALEMAHSMTKALGRELWIYHNRMQKQRRGFQAVA